jgi:hypothetical protein
MPWGGSLEMEYYSVKFIWGDVICECHIYFDCSPHYSTSNWFKYLIVDCPHSWLQAVTEHTHTELPSVNQTTVSLTLCLYNTVAQSNIGDGASSAVWVWSVYRCMLEEALNWISFHWSVFGCHCYSRENASENLEIRKGCWKRNDCFLSQHRESFGWGSTVVLQL